MGCRCELLSLVNTPPSECTCVVRATLSRDQITNLGQRVLIMTVEAWSWLLSRACAVRVSSSLAWSVFDGTFSPAFCSAFCFAFSLADLALLDAAGRVLQAGAGERPKA